MKMLRCFTRSVLFSLVFLIFFTPVCFAAGKEKKNVKEGNAFYQKGKLDEALEKYNEASVALPDSDIVNFNMGAALYKKQDYQKAIDAFTKALMSDNPKIEADALYDLGNCKYKLGKLKENTDLSSTVNLLKESLDYYKKAVELDQKNKEARINYEFVERELKVLLDKLKTQQDKQNKQDDQNKKGQEDKQDQQQGQVGQGQVDKQQEQEKEGQGQVDQGQEKQKEGQPAQAQEEKQGEEKKDGASAEQAQQELDKKDLTKEEARVLLERYGREDKPDSLDKQTTGGYDREVSKDW